MTSGHCALARANRVFRADEKRIRTESTVMDKNKDSFGVLLYKIVDCQRMSSYPFTIDDPRGRLHVRATSRRCDKGSAILGRQP
jgi:hypothetical protein